MPQKKQRKNAKPASHEEAYFGTRIDPDMLDLAMRLAEGLQHDPGTRMREEAEEDFVNEVLPLLHDDILRPSVDESVFKSFADTFALVIAARTLQCYPWIKSDEVEFPAKTKYVIAFSVKLDLDKGRREQPPTVDEFVEMLTRAGCEDDDPSNARKLAKEAGWTPTKEQTGPKPRHKSK